MKQLRNVLANLLLKIKTKLGLIPREKIIYIDNKDTEHIAFSYTADEREFELFPNIVFDYVKEEAAKEIGKYIIEHCLYDFKTFKEPETNRIK